ncbi:MAG: ribosomal RNA small subunit methyltransferase A [Candidatus Yanofskybacteria bacterium CG10_big_fil_rev_8_21_14_0_10_36_16]|uniref:Ribosomal RNA small subunit methyltransferase A n=1 Tax=Candidatus Yanofskybacteria bacterium CG10_big_fil_rev_8_21_14_0_10_36_16 TaxID=1975096 RepID=A0A2J0Q6I5_9BACT|nr:MAG: ribosomal RNA small subunit methyltransferase A [Candidatus Yanofskybacteria bacterium CG10_big_fil_rev_8_21_14_0_10_36_16]
MKNLTAEIKRELRLLNIRPKKSMGQNFLVNEGTYKKITETLELKPNETVIEVGPGLGILTDFLATTGANVIAVEKDDNLSEYLKNKFQYYKNVKIINEDILLFKPNDYKKQIVDCSVVGNIPYYLTSRLIRNIFESNNWKETKPKQVVLMIQKEVARRITARPPKMSLLAVSVQYYSKPKVISKVPRTNFYPQPEVDSAIIKMLPHKSSVSGVDDEKFFKVVKAGFSEKRKKISNNLSKQLKIDKQKIIKILEEINIDPGRRAETLTIEEWNKVAKQLVM